MYKELIKYIKKYPPYYSGFWGLSLIITSYYISIKYNNSLMLIKIINTLYSVLGIFAVSYSISKLSKKYEGIDDIYFSIIMFINIKLLSSDAFNYFFDTIIFLTLPATFYYFLKGLANFVKGTLSRNDSNIINYFELIILIMESIAGGISIFQIISNIIFR